MVSRVAIALQNPFEVRTEPLGGVAVLAAGLPVEDDVAARAAVDPEVAARAAAGMKPVEVADEGLVGTDQTACQHAILHARDEDAELVGDLVGSVAHGALAEVHAVALEVEHPLAMERQVIEVFVGEELGEQAGPPEAALDEGRPGGLDDRRAERLVAPDELQPLDVAEVEVAGLLLKLPAFLVACWPPAVRICLDEGGEDFLGDHRHVFGQPILADLAAAPGLLARDGCDLGFILRCVHVAGGVGLSRLAGGVGREEIGVVEPLALATEELALEVVELLAEE